MDTNNRHNQGMTRDLSNEPVFSRMDNIIQYSIKKEQDISDIKQSCNQRASK